MPLDKNDSLWHLYCSAGIYTTMTYTTSLPRQLNLAANFANNIKAAPTQSTLQICHASEPVKEVALPFAMERYLGEGPRGGGSTYGLVHGSGHQEIPSILAVIDFEFGEGKTAH